MPAEDAAIDWLFVAPPSKFEVTPPPQASAFGVCEASTTSFLPIFIYMTGCLVLSIETILPSCMLTSWSGLFRVRSTIACILSNESHIIPFWRFLISLRTEADKTRTKRTLRNTAPLSVFSLQLGLEGASIDNEFCSSKRVNPWRQIAQYSLFAFASSTAAEPDLVFELRVQLQAFRQPLEPYPYVWSQQSGSKEAAQEFEEAETCG